MSDSIGEVVLRKCKRWEVSFLRFKVWSTGNYESSMKTLEELTKRGYLSKKEQVNYSRALLALAGIE